MLEHQAILFQYTNEAHRKQTSQHIGQWCRMEFSTHKWLSRRLTEQQDPISGVNILIRKYIIQKKREERGENNHIYACITHGAYSNSLGKGAHIVNSNQEEKLHVNFEHDKRQYRKIHSAKDFIREHIQHASTEL